MLLSLSWLREFTPYEGTAQALGDRLTMLGLELEDLKNPYAALSQITTGYVVSCKQHPDSDHLHLCQVDVGQEALLDIVCGAPNVAQGQKVAVATIGTTMPNGMVIKKSKLRGETSYGMICSERELGLSEDHTGIMVLDSGTTVGQPLPDALNFDQEVLDLSITPNRADCLSVLGLARETAMAFHLPLTIPEVPLTFGNVSTDVSIEIRDPNLCWLYAGRVVHNIKIQASPLKIRQRLQAAGIRAISNIVDVTNYILLELGQPLHAFDLGKLTDQKIIVRLANEGEKFVTLDDQERILKSTDLCICDCEKPVALAGVMGGLNSEITPETKIVFVESAVFNPASIRKTSRRLGLGSESSYRFERGIDQRLTCQALDRACAMMASLGQGVVDAKLNIAEPKPFVPVKIDFSLEHANDLLGISLTEDFAKDVFTGLGCEMSATTNPWQITQPSWRPDLTREADLIEEVGRVYGLDNIPPALPPMHFSWERVVEKQPEFAFWKQLRHWAQGLGLNEAINYSFVGQKDLDLLNLPPEKRIPIKNPLSSDQDVLRTTVTPGLLASLRNNLAQGAFSIRLFELCHVFEEDLDAETKTLECPRLGILLSGLRHEPAWPYEPEDFDYIDLRGIIERLCAYLHIGSPSFVQRETHPYLLPVIDILVGDTCLGTLGRLEPKIADVYLAQKPVWLAELDLAALDNLISLAKLQFKPLAIFPCVRRDITFIGSEDLKVGQILAEIAKLKNPLLEDVTFVSLYQPEGSQDKHLSFRLTFRDPKRTLKDTEVERERDKVVQALLKALPVRI